jgi:hypothetical protein
MSLQDKESGIYNENCVCDYFDGLSSVSFSAEKSDIIAGPETDNCWRNNADRGKASECLHALSDISNKDMDELITNTVRQIKENNPGPVYKSKDPQLTIGDVKPESF